MTGLVVVVESVHASFAVLGHNEIMMSYSLGTLYIELS